MKGIFKAAVVVATALSATSVFAAGLFSRAPDRVGRTYTEASYWSTPRAAVPNESSASAGGSYSAPVVVNGPIVTTPAQSAVAPGPTMRPYMPGDTISNASSSLWGVGG
jgi:hypothetical protein